MKPKNESPLVMCITNSVAANFTANCLLAIGAKPAMISEPSEASELAAVADAVLINLGTVDANQSEVMRAAVQTASAIGVPWVLDPVAVHLLSFRRNLCQELLASNPSLIRGNHAEIDFLCSSGLLPNSTAILSTGETDKIYPTLSSISGGVSLLQAVTATGCAQGALCAAFLGWGQAPEQACVNASKIMKNAGERAYSKSRTPGSFQIAIIDALWELTHD